jgi:hypothetical protein
MHEKMPKLESFWDLCSDNIRICILLHIVLSTDAGSIVINVYIRI